MCSSDRDGLGLKGVAIDREKSLKPWPRQRKINLIEATNPHWADLYPRLAWRGPAATSHPASPSGLSRGSLSRAGASVERDPGHKAQGDGEG